MGLVLATTFAGVVWIVLWALGAKGFDAFMVAALIVILAATVKLAAPYLANRD